MMRIESESELDTWELGRSMAGEAMAGDIYALSGDLGAGKTVFARGFAEGLGIEALVTSPTFTIVKSYTGGRLPLHHFDAYRILDPEEMEAIGYEEYFFGDGVTLIEWPDRIAPLLPPGVTFVSISRDPARGSDYRLIEIGEEG